MFSVLFTTCLAAALLLTASAAAQTTTTAVPQPTLPPPAPESSGWTRGTVTFDRVPNVAISDCTAEVLIVSVTTGGSIVMRNCHIGRLEFPGSMSGVNFTASGSRFGSPTALATASVIKIGSVRSGSTVTFEDCSVDLVTATDTNVFDFLLMAGSSVAIRNSRVVIDATAGGKVIFADAPVYTSQASLAITGSTINVTAKDSFQGVYMKNVLKGPTAAVLLSGNTVHMVMQGVSAGSPSFTVLFAPQGGTVAGNWRIDSNNVTFGTRHCGAGARALAALVSCNGPRTGYAVDMVHNNVSIVGAYQAYALSVRGVLGGNVSAVHNAVSISKAGYAHAVHFSYASSNNRYVFVDKGFIHILGNTLHFDASTTWAGVNGRGGIYGGATVLVARNTIAVAWSENNRWSSSSRSGNAVTVTGDPVKGSLAVGSTVLVQSNVIQLKNTVVSYKGVNQLVYVKRAVTDGGNVTVCDNTFVSQGDVRHQTYFIVFSSHVALDSSAAITGNRITASVVGHAAVGVSVDTQAGGGGSQVAVTRNVVSLQTTGQELKGMFLIGAVAAAHNTLTLANNAPIVPFQLRGRLNVVTSATDNSIVVMNSATGNVANGDGWTVSTHQLGSISVAESNASVVLSRNTLDATFAGHTLNSDFNFVFIYAPLNAAPVYVVIEDNTATWTETASPAYVPLVAGYNRTHIHAYMAQNVAVRAAGNVFRMQSCLPASALLGVAAGAASANFTLTGNTASGDTRLAVFEANPVATIVDSTCNVVGNSLIAMPSAAYEHILPCTAPMPPVMPTTPPCPTPAPPTTTAVPPTTTATPPTTTAVPPTTTPVPPTTTSVPTTQAAGVTTTVPTTQAAGSTTTEPTTQTAATTAVPTSQAVGATTQTPTTQASTAHVSTATPATSSPVSLPPSTTAAPLPNNNKATTPGRTLPGANANGGAAANDNTAGQGSGLAIGLGAAAAVLLGVVACAAVALFVARRTQADRGAMEEELHDAEEGSPLKEVPKVDAPTEEHHGEVSAV
jgi:hypothetical protein